MRHLRQSLQAIGTDQHLLSDNKVLSLRTLAFGLSIFVVGPLEKYLLMLLFAFSVFSFSSSRFRFAMAGEH